jgi:2-hydroxychromene-2-carboxylate isomerase
VSKSLWERSLTARSPASGLSARLPRWAHSLHRGPQPGQIITDDTVNQVAGSVGLDLGRLKQDMDAPEIGAALKANRALALNRDTGGVGTSDGDC